MIKNIAKVNLTYSGCEVTLREITVTRPVEGTIYDIKIVTDDFNGFEPTVLDCKSKEAATSLFEAIKKYAY